MNIVVKSDYDGYFESLVRSWVARKPEPKHKTILITAGPYRMAAVSYASDAETLYLDFYSALRRGFGCLSKEEVDEIVEII